GVNLNNDGATGLTIASPGNIVRYNSAYGTMHNPMKTKYGDGYGWQASGGTRNRIFNNTLYKGGYGYPTFEAQSPWPRPLQGFRWYQPSDSAGNVLKNNIVYGSYGAVAKGLEDIGDNPSANVYFANNLCTNTDGEKCSVVGDPKFMNPSLTQTTSLVLPDLRLQSGSPAVDKGASLTTVISAADQRHIRLADPLYFQDGTWGAAMARGVTIFPDWIAIGSGSNIAQISSINYSTGDIVLASAPVNAIKSGDKVWLYTKSDGSRVFYGSAPDIGAYEREQVEVYPGPPQRLRNGS
ncbi:MAG: hypothetical protein IH628_12245, partial [Proteobacteria bacterium]|nr:hypothetical protein [Pseudomonadota bacterium]